MAELKTRQNEASVAAFLDRVEDDGKRKDCLEVVKMMKRATGAEPKMWGTSIVGFGSAPYKYASGREGIWFQIGFSPRKGDLTLYLIKGCEAVEPLLGKLGRHKTGKCCLYIKRLSDVDTKVLDQIIRKSAGKRSRS
jgi:hypothetical protein